jgi:ATP-dependent DNA helicase RecG
MTKNEVLHIIQSGEDIRTEFKISSTKLPSTLFETVCAFLNTVGGIILLGVDDDRKIIGVEKNLVSKLKIDIANQSNNPQKLDPVFMLSVSEVIIDNKIILVIKVPESAEVHKTNNQIYLRNEDGDYKVTRLEKLAEIVNRKKNYYSEQTVFPHIKFDDFDVNLIRRAKRLIRANNPEHHWLDLPGREFMLRAGFYKTSGGEKDGYTLAAVLFFGSDELIQSIVPAYKFEALVRKENIDRYDDRITIRTNILDAYDLLMGFIEKHVNDPFYLEGTTRISLRSKIFRELVANLIAHQEYLNASPAVITIFENKIEFIDLK